MNTKKILITMLLLALLASLTALFTGSPKTEIVYQDRIIEKEIPVEVFTEEEVFNHIKESSEEDNYIDDALREGFNTIPYPYSEVVNKDSCIIQTAIIKNILVFKSIEYDGRGVAYHQYLVVDHNQECIEGDYGLAHKNKDSKLRYYLLDRLDLSLYFDYSSGFKKPLFDFKNKKVYIDVKDGIVKKITTQDRE